MEDFVKESKDGVIIAAIVFNIMLVVIGMVSYDSLKDDKHIEVNLQYEIVIQED